MANYTPNYNLTKPLQTEYYNVSDFNSNADIIDAAMYANQTAAAAAQSAANSAQTVAEAAQQAVTAVTPVLNLAENGSAKFGNLLIQWGKTTATKNSSLQTVYFEPEFSTLYNVQITPVKYSDLFAISAAAATYMAIDTSAFVSETTVETSIDIYWLVIGTAANTS